MKLKQLKQLKQKDMKTKISELTGTFVIGNHELTFMQIQNQTYVQFTNRNSEEFDDGMYRITDMKHFIDIASKIVINKTNDEIISIVTKNINSEQKQNKNLIKTKNDKVVINEFMLN